MFDRQLCPLNDWKAPSRSCPQLYLGGIPFGEKTQRKILSFSVGSQLFADSYSKSQQWLNVCRGFISIFLLQLVQLVQLDLLS